MKIIGIALVLVLVLLLLPSVFAVSRNEITNLPGLTFEPNFRQFSGEITVDQSHGRNLFYWLVESQSSPSTDPLVVWFNGGPGCGSLIGMITENGPYIPLPDGLDFNPYSWNRIANVLYIESPAGVGFSYSNDPNDYNTNNEKTARDNLTFLQEFLKVFPEYRTRDLWLTGESYAGDYVPQLAILILKTGGALAQNLKGLMLGNPVMDCDNHQDNDWFNNVQMQLLVNHAVVPYIMAIQWNKLGCVTHSGRQECTTYLNNLLNYLQTNSQFTPDNLYTDACTGNATLDISQRSPDCQTISGMMTNYLNRDDVQTAIYAHKTPWVMCSSSLNYTSDWPNMNQAYQFFFDNYPNLRILIYSGDVDIATVPHMMTQICISLLNRLTTGPWRNYQVGGIVAGFVQDYDGLTYATIKGAGHEAPTYVPSAAYYIFSQFLQGKKI